MEIIYRITDKEGVINITDSNFESFMMDLYRLNKEIIDIYITENVHPKSDEEKEKLEKEIFDFLVNMLC